MEYNNGLRRRNNELTELTNFVGRVIGAKHCSSLCSQSEGDGYVANLPDIYADNVAPLPLKGAHI